MDRELTITPILINHHSKPGANTWVKLLMYEPDDADKAATKGKMYAVLSLASAAQMDFAPLMEMIIESLRQKYFDAENGGILQSLEITLDAIHKQLLLAGQQDKRLSAGFSFDILVAVNWGTVLYLGQLGESRACLVREAKLFDIDEGGQRTSGAFLSSGVLRAGDRFMLATNQLLNKFNRKQLLHHLSLGADTMAQSIEQQLDRSENSQESGIILQVDIKHVPSAEEESLQILNSDTMTPPPRVGAAISTLSSVASGTFKTSRHAASGLWEWRIFGKIPGVPVAIIVLCALLLFGSIVFKPLTANKQKTADLAPLVSQLSDQLDQAEDLAAVNPDRAAEVLQQMEPTLTQALDAHSDDRLQKIADQKLRLKQQLLRIHVLTPHPLADFSGTPLSAKMIKLDNDIFMLTDPDRLIRLHDGQVTTLASGQRFLGSKITATDSRIAVGNEQSIFPVDKNGDIEDSTSLGTANVLAASSYRENAYLLAQDGQLHKFVYGNQSFEGPSSYFDTPIDKEGLVDVAIDGEVYILRQNGAVEKYLTGKRQPLSIERSSLIEDPRAIFTSESLENFYILTNRALLAWNKDGQYIGQYQLPGEAVWQAALVDGVDKNLYILSEGKLVEAKLP